jgi:hypothetical protein
MRDRRFRRLDRPPAPLVSFPRLLAYAVLAPVLLALFMGAAGYVASGGHPAALDKGIFSGFLVGVVFAVGISWPHDRKFALAQIAAAVVLVLLWIVINPVYKIYVARDPADVRLKLIDQRPDQAASLSFVSAFSAAGPTAPRRASR